MGSRYYQVENEVRAEWSFPDGPPKCDGLNVALVERVGSIECAFGGVEFDTSNLIVTLDGNVVNRMSATRQGFVTKYDVWCYACEQGDE